MTSRLVYRSFHVQIKVILHLSLEVPEYAVLTEGAPVAQWVKRWPADLVVQSLSPAQGEISAVNGVPLHIAFHYLPLILLI